MTQNNILPGSRAALVNADGSANNAYYKFFLSLTNQVINVVASVKGKADASITISGSGSIAGGGDLTQDRMLSLVGDVDNPIPLSFYGDLQDGTKGWQRFSLNFQQTAQFTTEYLDLSDTGVTAGTYGDATHIPIPTIDAKGRITGITQIQISTGSTHNYAVNGAFDVWQLGTTFTASNLRPDADCWQVFGVGCTIATTRQSAIDSGLPTNVKYFCRDVVSSTAGDSNLAQRILRFEDAFELAGKTAQFAMYARCSIAANVGFSATQLYGDNAGAPMYGAGPFGLQSFALAANEWTAINGDPFTFPAVFPAVIPDAGTGGTQIALWMSSGSLYETSEFTIGIQSATFDWALVSLSEGNVNFDRTPMDETIRRCERYREKSFSFDTAPAQNAGMPGANVSSQSVGSSTASAINGVRYRQDKPRAGNITLYNPLSANAQPRNVALGTDWASAAIIAASSGGFGLTATSAAGSAAGNTIGYHWLVDAQINPAWVGGTSDTRETDDLDSRITDDGELRSVLV